MARPDDVTVVRDFDGPPPTDFPPKGVVKEIEVRYGIKAETVDFIDGRVRVVGQAQVVE